MSQLRAAALTITNFGDQVRDLTIIIGPSNNVKSLVKRAVPPVPIAPQPVSPQLSPKIDIVISEPTDTTKQETLRISAASEEEQKKRTEEQKIDLRATKPDLR